MFCFPLGSIKLLLCLGYNQSLIIKIVFEIHNNIKTVETSFPEFGAFCQWISRSERNLPRKINKPQRAFLFVEIFLQFKSVFKSVS